MPYFTPAREENGKERDHFCFSSGCIFDRPVLNRNNWAKPVFGEADLPDDAKRAFL
jgi:hypothetical protein